MLHTPIPYGMFVLLTGFPSLTNAVTENPDGTGKGELSDRHRS
jgi:hypothetical protein